MKWDCSYSIAPKWITINDNSVNIFFNLKQIKFSFLFKKNSFSIPSISLVNCKTTTCGLHIVEQRNDGDECKVKISVEDGLAKLIFFQK